MKYHILTPFSRIENKEKILENFHCPNVIFHPIMEFCKYFEFPKEKWIEPFGYDRDAGITDKKVCFHAVNKFLDANPLVENDYYIYLADDDFVEPNFFKKLKGIETPFILVSMKRGIRKAGSGYGTNTLIPHWRRLTRSRVAWEQLLIKGKYLQDERFKDDMTADGQFIGSLWKKYPKEYFTFKTDAYVWFNYLEPGRWEKSKGVFKTMDIRIGSHIPVLIKVMEISEGPVLELGSGYFSTPILYWLCKAQGREFVSYENDKEWQKIFKVYKDGVQDIVRYIDDWDKAPIDRKWGVVFIDHKPAKRRIKDMKRLAHLADYVVVHDTQPGHEKQYKYHWAFPKYKYIYTFDKAWPYTSVLSNFKDLKNL